MSNIQDYINACTENADNSAQRLRNLANVIGDEQYYEDGVCTIADVQRMTKRGINNATTELQNLVREMADQLEAERAEFERMKRLYAMARKEASHFEDIVKRAEAQAKAAFA